MNQEMAAATPINSAIVEQVLVHGDLSSLSSQQRTEYLLKVCDGMGLNPLTKPFEFIKLNNKLTLYCTRAGTDQIRKVNKVSLKITSRETMEGVYIVTAQATMHDGRTDESTGAVSITGLKGEALANAFLKAETKAKRRVTLSIVGLGWLDESEIDSIPGAQKYESYASESTQSAKPLHIIPPVAAAQSASTQYTGQEPYQGGYQPAHQPAYQQGHQVSTYVIPFGKFKGKTFDEVGERDLVSYANYLRRKAEQDNKPIDSHSTVGIFCSNVDEYTNQLHYKDSDHENDISEKFAKASLDNQTSEDLPF